MSAYDASTVEAARKARARGRTYVEIAQAAGAHTQTVRAWCDPEYRQRRRAEARAFKRRTRAERRAYDRRYGRRDENRGRCTLCGQKRGIGMATDGVCARCIRLAKHRRARRIERWWAAGLTRREIARRLGWTENRLSVELAQLRRRGYTLPDRRRRTTNDEGGTQ